MESETFVGINYWLKEAQEPTVKNAYKNSWKINQCLLPRNVDFDFGE